jgi:hypothetical protein
MDELDKVSDESHNCEPNSYCPAELDVFCQCQSAVSEKGDQVHTCKAVLCDLPLYVGLVHRLTNWRRDVNQRIESQDVTDNP